jgi:hypothetical protein
LGQLIQHRFFQITKGSLSIALKGLPDGAAQALFNDVVGIKEGKVQPSGELPTDGGFSGAWEADQGNQDFQPAIRGICGNAARRC